MSAQTPSGPDPLSERPEFMFQVTLPSGRHNQPMVMRRVVDVDIFVERLARNRRTDVVVQELDGLPVPYENWRSGRPEPRLPTTTIDLGL